ncbi:MAG TPA: prenyltransferase/squalene oxidase repeat-containing protein [Planctomycetaceae bacterium]
MLFGLAVIASLGTALVAPVRMATGYAADDKAGINVQRVAQARLAGVEFLRATQADDGSWTSPTAPGVSGLITTALLKSGVAPTDPMAEKALRHLATFIQKDGGIYEAKSDHRNYETSICLMAFQAANEKGRYDKEIANARDFLKKLQWDESEDVKPDDVRFGGAGYGRSQRPDLSNTSFLLEALKAAGVGPDDPAMKNAVVFVSRCQNLESEHNTTPFASKVNDGGFYYTPAGGGNSQAGPTDNGGLRSYASMTYSGLKSMIYAGVDPKDPRVQAAFKWIQKHYSLEENPGMGQAGLYYYYHTFAKALDTMKLKTLEDASGKKHDWRTELTNHLLSLQKENGGWVNSEKKWMEGDPNMATAYALLTLAVLVPPK